MAEALSGSEDVSSSDESTDEYASEDESSEYSDDKDDKQESNDKSSKESDGRDRNKICSEDIKTYFRVDLMYNKTGGEWPNTTCIDYKLKLSSRIKHSKDSKSNKRIRRGKLFNSTEHAEITLLNNLKEELDSFQCADASYMLEKLQLDSPAHHASSRKEKKMMKMKLKIVINYSPCKNCADQIEQFKKKFEKNYEIHISITFGSFYKFYPKDDKTKNMEGLANLQNAGIKLRLVWDSESLKKKIKKIGTKKERKERKKKDREYMELVEEKAKEIADSMHKT